MRTSPVRPDGQKGHGRCRRFRRNEISKTIVCNQLWKIHLAFIMTVLGNTDNIRLFGLPLTLF